ncbi:MAG TPA: TerB family tellurite resistance protein [Myxococcota bacterium]|nr:TerB family tellurite resistance protein [Myxococcota bacterium]
MASLLRFLGLRGDESAAASGAETDTVRRIAARLDQLDPQIAKYLAAFAYVLARVAHADLEIDETETAKMQEIIRTVGRLSEDEAVLAVEIAKSQARVLGGTENYVVTREFKRISSPEQRGRLLECLYAVAAADGSISSVESQEIQSIAEELGLTREEANTLRSRYRDKLAVFQKH